MSRRPIPTARLMALRGHTVRLVTDLSPNVHTAKVIVGDLVAIATTADVRRSSIAVVVDRAGFAHAVHHHRVIDAEAVSPSPTFMLTSSTHPPADHPDHGEVICTRCGAALSGGRPHIRAAQCPTPPPPRAAVERTVLAGLRNRGAADITANMLLGLRTDPAHPGALLVRINSGNNSLAVEDALTAAGYDVKPLESTTTYGTVLLVTTKAGTP